MIRFDTAIIYHDDIMHLALAHGLTEQDGIDIMNEVGYIHNDYSPETVYKVLSEKVNASR